MPSEVLFDKEKALKKAMQLFWLKGYNGTSMDELTKATGLSRSSIYNSFGDKHGIFIQCLHYYKNMMRNKVLLSLDQLNSPLKKIELLFRLNIDALLKDKEKKGCLIVNTTTELANMEEEIWEFINENKKDIESLFQELIKEGQQSGEISRSFSSLALARHLYNSFSGLKIIAQTTNDRKTLEDILNVSLSILRQ